LNKIEKDKVNKSLEDISTIKHTLNNQQNVLTTALKEKEDLQDLIETLQELVKKIGK
jgi:GTP-binding protein EngB required for normal cell division